MSYRYKDLGIFDKLKFFSKEELESLSDNANRFLCCMDGADFSNNHTRKDRMYRIFSSFNDRTIEETKALFAVNDMWEWFWFMQKVEECKAEREYSKILFS